MEAHSKCLSPFDLQFLQTARAARCSVFRKLARARRSFWCAIRAVAVSSSRQVLWLHADQVESIRHQLISANALSDESRFVSCALDLFVKGRGRRKRRRDVDFEQMWLQLIVQQHVEAEQLEAARSEQPANE